MSNGRGFSLNVSETVAQEGFLFLQSLCPSASPEEAISSLGSLLILGEGPAIHYLSPKLKCDEPPNTYSGNFGLGVFPFHTDLAHHRYPPKYMILRCIRGYPSVKTLLIDSASLIKEVGETDARRALVRSRRRVNGEIPLLSLYEETKIGSRFRWDKLFLLPASQQGAKIFAQVITQIDRQKEVEVNLVEPGDTLIIDNWRMLHSRSSVPVRVSDRKIARAYAEELA